MARSLRPEYVFRPQQVFRRLAFSLAPPVGRQTADTPWGLPLNIDAGEVHGRAILSLGLVDLRTLEIISRILKPGDVAVDIGANIGLMTSLMAMRTGTNGLIFAVEPHPITRAGLEANVALWSDSGYSVAGVTILPVALSSDETIAFLSEPEEFRENSGVARLIQANDASGSGFSVQCRSYDQLFGDFETVKLVKIDVEGHEDEVLSGMERSLRSCRIENLIIEEFRELPSPASRLLTGLGYKVFQIDRTFWGPRLVDVGLRPPPLQGETTNILAVRNSEFVTELQRPGWTCLRS